MATLLSFCAIQGSDGIAIWVGRTKTTTQLYLTDQHDDRTKTETKIFLPYVIELRNKDVNLSELKLNIPEGDHVIGLVRFRNKGIWFPEPTLWDRKFCQQLLQNVHHSISPTFIFTSACKVRHSTKVYTFIVDVKKPNKFVPVELHVENLGNVPCATYAGPSSSNVSQLFPLPPAIMPKNTFTQEVFKQFHRQYDELEAKEKAKRIESKKLQEEIDKLILEINMQSVEDNSEEKEDETQPVDDETSSARKRRGSVAGLDVTSENLKISSMNIQSDTTPRHQKNFAANDEDDGNDDDNTRDASSSPFLC